MDDWAIEVLREEFSEDINQWRLTDRLGQPTCGVSHIRHFFFLDPDDGPCPGCGAAL